MPKRSFSTSFPTTLSLGMGAGGTLGGGTPYRGVRTKPKYRKAAPKVSKGVKAYVKRALRADEEIKVQLDPISANVVQYIEPFIGVLSGTTNVTALIPRLPQGVAQGERLGSEIRPRSLHVKGCINLSGKVAQCWNIRVRVMVVQDRSNLDQSQKAQFVNVMAGSLLMSASGGGGVVGYNGRASTHFLPINTDRYDVLHDTEFPMSLAAGTTSQQSPLVAGNMTSMSSNNSRVLDFKVRLPAKLKYDDGASGAYPTNAAPYLLVGWCNADEDQVYSSNGPVPLYYTFHSVLSYTDA